MSVFHFKKHEYGVLQTSDNSVIRMGAIYTSKEPVEPSPVRESSAGEPVSSDLSMLSPYETGSM